MKHLLTLSLLFCASLCWSQGNLTVFTGNVDRIQYIEFKVVNPDPSHAPLTIPQIGVEYHIMDQGYVGFPQDLEIYFPLFPDNLRNLNNCVKWFKRVQAHELNLDINHQPGIGWDGTKSPWPYLQIAIAPGTKQVHTYDLQGRDVWLWPASAVQCWEVMDWRAPYFPNQ